MKISINWLKDFLDIPKSVSPEKMAMDLTVHTCEVEKVERSFTGYENIVIGEIKEISSHPNADKLKVTRTDVGDEIVQIVCGGTNIYVGMKCVVAKLGAKVLWHGKDEMVMEKVKLRGEESNGMICASEEVNLEHLFKHNEHEVVDLSNLKNIEIGDSVTKLMGRESIVVDIDNKSLTHRPDLWGHYGIAREISAIYKIDLKSIPLSDVKFGKENIDVKIIAKDRCPRFQIVKISGLKIEKSPQWIKERLEEVGVRSISNIVDVTNYVMLELGQPMHAYDAKKIVGGFNIRLSEKGEKFQTLDGVIRNLTGNEVLVCDEEKILGLGGIMGGQTSEVSDSTDTIYLESANWTKTPIRKTSVELGLRTEAVSRYEKGLDPYLTEKSILRAITLLKELCPSIKIESSLSDEKNFTDKKNEIKVDLKRVGSVIGIDVDKKSFKDYLSRLGFEVNFLDDNISNVTVPSFRATGDIETEDDIIEEIARMIGYQNIGEKLLSIESKIATRTKQNILEKKLRLILKSVGFTEVMTYSFVSEELQKKFFESTSGLLEVKKPLSSDLTHLRNSLKNRVLEVVAKNKSENSINIFEIGHVHFKEKKGQDNLPLEDIRLICIISRKISKKSTSNIFYNMKGVLEKISSEIGFEFNLKTSNDDKYSLLCDILVDKKSVGYLGNISEKILINYGISKKEISIMEFSLKNLDVTKLEKVKYHYLPKYPSMVIGMTLVVPEKVTCEELLVNIKSLNEKLLNKVEIIDIYRGEQIGEGNKSIAIDLTYLDSSKTLEEAEVKIIHEKIIDSLKKLGVSHR